MLHAIKEWLPFADGFTITGGEPFDQLDALIALLTGIRRLSSKDIFVYSGYQYEAIEQMVAKTAGLIDALMSDPFDIKAAQTMALRGSDNQRLHLLTSLGRSRFLQFERFRGERDRRLDVMFDENGEVWFAGIPGRGDFQQLHAMLEQEGHRVFTTGDRRISARKVCR